MEIRPMQKKDIETVYELGSNVDGFQVAEGSGFWQKEQLYNWVESPDDVLFVAEEDGKVVGYVMATLHKPTGKATAENLYVDPQHRRGGIGLKLLLRCLEGLKAKGATYVCGLAKVENKPPIELLKAAGFKRGFDFAWMEKHL